MSAPDPALASTLQDIRENDTEVSKPRPPQPASPYEGNSSRHLERPTHGQEADLRMRTITIEDLVLDPVTREVSRGSREIQLTLEEFSVLCFLMRRAETKVHPQELLHVREIAPNADRSHVESVIHKLRAKIDFPGEPQLIFQCGSLFQLGGTPPPQAVAGMPKAIRDEWDARFERMQTPEARAALQAAFDASPEEMGKAAVAAARKRD